MGRCPASGDLLPRPVHWDRHPQHPVGPASGAQRLPAAAAPGLQHRRRQRPLRARLVAERAYGQPQDLQGCPALPRRSGHLGQRDTFVLSGAEDLVPVAEPRPGTTLPWSPTPPTPAGSSAGSCRGPPTRSAGAVGERRTFKADAARPAPLTFLVDTAGQHDRRWTRTSPGPISHSSKNVRTPPAQRRHSLVHGEGVAGKGGQLLGGGVELWTNS